MQEKVLIIVQEQSLGLRMQKMFANSGFIVAGVFDDAYKGLRLLRSQEIHLTVFEAALPAQSYKRFAEIIEYEDLGPLLLVGAEAGNSIHELPSSVYGVVSMPVSREQLLQNSRMAIRQYRINQKLKNELHTLRRKLTDRKVIDQAKYILMHKDNIDENEAYEKIRQVSMNRRLSLSKVAEIIIDHHNKKKIT